MAVPRGVEPPTFGLGNRFVYKHFNDLRQNVANVLHLFRRQEFCSHASDS
jgi:hypothetical protein